MAGIQKLSSTSVATVNITDADALQEGVDHYNVFVKVGSAPGINSEVDKYQTVTSTGSKDIDLSSLTNGQIVPLDSEVVYFTVVAIDTAGNTSIPSVNDSTTVTWDNAGPGTPSGLTLSDDAGEDTMTVSWQDQTADIDLDHFEFYANIDAVATPSQYTYFQVINSKSFTGGEMATGDGNDLEGAQNGNDIHVSVYAVDKYGNKSVAAQANAIYNTSN